MRYMVKKSEPKNAGLIWDTDSNRFWEVDGEGNKVLLDDEVVGMLPRVSKSDYVMNAELYCDSDPVRPSDGEKFFESQKWTGYKEI